MILPRLRGGRINPRYRLGATWLPPTQVCTTQRCRTQAQCGHANWPLLHCTQKNGSAPWHCEARKQRCPSAACAGAPAPTSVLNAATAANNVAVFRKVLITTAPLMPTECGASPVTKKVGVGCAAPSPRYALRPPVRARAGLDHAAVADAGPMRADILAIFASHANLRQRAFALFGPFATLRGLRRSAGKRAHRDDGGKQCRGSRQGFHGVLPK
jgi:hypothetical protein